jgi:hypothetical protein
MRSTSENTIFLTNGDAAYRASISALAESFARGQVIPFFGAGISTQRWSCLPLARDLIKPLQDALWHSVEHVVTAPGLHSEDVQAAVDVVRAAPLERLLAVLAETHGRECTINEYLSMLLTNLWNWNHAAVGALAAKGHVNCCITLNFDLLIEEAVTAHGGACIIDCPLSGQPPLSFGSSSRAVRIIKPHGSVLPSTAQDRFRLVATTLPEVGDRPHPRNHRALANALRPGAELLVAGYSDDDWDIFPIIAEFATQLSHVHWVHFARPPAIRTGRAPWDSNNPREQRIREWLTGSGVKFTSYVGSAVKLLVPVARHLGLQVKRPPLYNRPNRRVTADMFTDTAVASTRTAVSTAILLQDGGRFHDALAQWLLSSKEIQSDAVLEARVRRVLAQTLHTRRRLRSAMRQMKRILALKAKAYRSLEFHSADDVFWFGYEHICRIKRPGISALAAPYYYKRGFKLMMHAISLTRKHDTALGRQMVALVRYYRVDLLHTWAGHLLFLGHRFPFTARIFRPISVLYDGLRRRHPALMEWDYYWLRAFESDVLSHKINLTAEELHRITSKLNMIQRRYDILQNYVQSGNVDVYRALLQFAKDQTVIPDALQRAEDVWTGAAGVKASGLYRVLQYRRYFGLDSPWATLRKLILHLLRRG